MTKKWYHKSALMILVIVVFKTYKDDAIDVQSSHDLESIDAYSKDPNCRVSMAIY